MATASAQREPSMEEILASIRRIIEDSDTGRKQPADAGELRQDLHPAPVVAPVAEVDAFRSELHAETSPRKPASPAEPQLAAVEAEVGRAEARPEPVRPVPTTLAEVGARVASEPGASAGTSGSKTAPQTAETIVADWRREIAAAGGGTVTAKATARMPETAPIVEIDEEDLTDAPVVETADVGPSVSRSFSAEATPARPAILSEHAGRQVAAAFGELSDAFASRSKKTFDEMAEEMLRPMLQDWLDNNLPTLVERLVREEIERVARGAQ